MDVYCRLCKKDKPWKSFVDDDGNVSTRCADCRFQEAERIKTGPHTPEARKASGRWRVDELVKKDEDKDKDK